MGSLSIGSSGGSAAPSNDSKDNKVDQASQEAARQAQEAAERAEEARRQAEVARRFDKSSFDTGRDFKWLGADGGGNAFSNLPTFKASELLRGGAGLSEAKPNLSVASGAGLKAQSLDYDPEALPIPDKDPSVAATDAKSALDQINSLQEQYTTDQAELGKELSDVGAALDRNERQAFIEAFKDKHPSMRNMEAAQQTLDDNLKTLAASPSSLTPASAQTLLDGYKALSTGPHAAAAFDFLRQLKDSSGDPTGLKAALLNNLDADSVKSACTDIFTNALSSTVKQMVPQLQYSGNDPALLSQVADHFGDIVSGALDTDLIAQGEQAKGAIDTVKKMLTGAPTNDFSAWDTLKGSFGSLSKVEKAIVGVGAGLYATSALSELSQGQYPEAVRDFLFTAQSSVQIFAAFSETANVAVQAGLTKAVPVLGAAANGLSAILHARDSAKNGDTALAFAAAADVAAAVGSAAFFTPWGPPLAVAASAVSAALDGLSKLQHASNRGKEETDILAGILGNRDDAKSLVYGTTNPLNYISQQTNLSGKNLRQALKDFPTLAGANDLSGLGDVVRAAGLSGNGTADILKSTLNGLDDTYGDTLGPVFAKLNSLLISTRDPDGEYGGKPLTRDQWKQLLLRVADNPSDYPGVGLSDSSAQAMRNLANAL